MSVDTETKPAPPFVAAIIELERVSAQLLAKMAEGSLEEGHMPPAPVMQWYVGYSTQSFIMLEHLVVNDGDTEQEKNLPPAVEQISTLLRILDKAKMYTLAHDTRNTLNARKLRYPTHMDLTYGGRLP